MILTANTFESKHCVFINLVHGFITSVHVDISCFFGRRGPNSEKISSISKLCNKILKASPEKLILIKKNLGFITDSAHEMSVIHFLNILFISSQLNKENTLETVCNV